jgi:hypothetical protein
MKLVVKRGKGAPDFTPGELFIDDKFECYTLEDERRTIKVMHETCVAEGTYNIVLRTFGGHHDRYKNKFPDIHKGMLWVKDVPKFSDILIHIGNTDDDTSGCLLVGSAIDVKLGRLYRSTEAYLKMYKKVRDAIVQGDNVTITYKSEE